MATVRAMHHSSYLAKAKLLLSAHNEQASLAVCASFAQLD